MKYLLLVAALIFFSCEKEQLTAKDLLAEMKSISARIDLITDTGCEATTSCKAVPVGKKACGGPTHYIIYSTVSSEDELTKLISRYNKLNEQYNKESGLISNCAIETPPMLNCISGECEVIP